jgi:hypothetical protein
MTPNILAQYAARIEELEKALEWYADEENYQIIENENDPFDIELEQVVFDKGERARQALKEGSYDKVLLP